MLYGPWRDVNSGLHLAETYAFCLIEDVPAAELIGELMTPLNIVASGSGRLMLCGPFLYPEAPLSIFDVRAWWTLLLVNLLIVYASST